MTRRGFALLAIAVAAHAVPASAQNGTELLAQGIRAYQGIDYEAAAGLLRRSLAATGPQALPDTARLRALSYLGATEVFRKRSDSAAAAFRILVLTDPRYRPDQLIFPPEVTNAFEATRRATKVVAVVVPADTMIVLGDELLPVRVYASSFHEIGVMMADDEGRPLRSLYTGPIGDSIVVRWDGLDAAGSAPATGRFRLIVTSRDPQGRVLRQLRVPLSTRLAAADTLPWPRPLPDTALLPEHGPSGPALRSLGAGVGAGLVVALLPSVMGSGKEASGSRFVVAGAVSLTGLYGFLTQRPSRPIVANVTANRARRDAWQRSRDQVAQENATRRKNVRLRIMAAAPQTGEAP